MFKKNNEMYAIHKRHCVGTKTQYLCEVYSEPVSNLKIVFIVSRLRILLLRLGKIRVTQSKILMVMPRYTLIEYTNIKGLGCYIVFRIG